MSNIVSIHTKPSNKITACNKHLLELIDYLFSLKENNFSGQVEIEFNLGSVDRIAFNQKNTGCFDLLVNE